MLHNDVLHPGTRTKICQISRIVQTKTSPQLEEFGTQRYGDGQMFLIPSGDGEVGGTQVRPPHQPYFLNVILNRISPVFLNRISYDPMPFVSLIRGCSHITSAKNRSS